MKKLAVFFHVYYHNQVDYFIEKLGNINNCEWDLFVSYSTYSSTTEQKIRAFKPDAQFIPVENVGYDIWPFIKAIKSVDISQYDLVMKLHTKNKNVKVNKINGMRLSGYLWRNLLVDSMLRSRSQFRKCSRILEDERVGMVCGYEVLKTVSGSLPEDSGKMKTEAMRIGFRTDHNKFCAGTMFIARSEALQAIAECDANLDTWDAVSQSHSCGSMAHIYERLLSFSTFEAGLDIKTVVTYPWEALIVYFHSAIGPAIKFLFSLEREGEDRDKYLTFIGVKVKLSR
ncbi:MAG: rhamnan synthesis F family protein [Candidatus Cryptobacteroides sp.]